MTQATKKINKEQYERAMQHNGYIADSDMDSIFSIGEQMGYGVYCPRAKEVGGEYYVDYELGDSCD